MPTPTSGYSQEVRNLGGLGTVRMYKSSTDHYRLSCLKITASPSGETRISLGGFPIGVGIVNEKKLVYVYTTDITPSDLEISIWDGVPIEFSSNGSIRAIAMASGGTSASLPSLSNKTLVLGGAHINKDNQDRILVIDKGTPEEKKITHIGSKPIEVGRFGNVWAIGCEFLTMS